ncbi:hypothetical protein MTBUT4_480024 [Magnetospirillum sp. UT-4]|nr:hypothetical protein MTBUT4_480024 [Magnetospirillum sp. UT-4]
MAQKIYEFKYILRRFEFFYGAVLYQVSDRLPLVPFVSGVVVHDPLVHKGKHWD